MAPCDSDRKRGSIKGGEPEAALQLSARERSRLKQPVPSPRRRRGTGINRTAEIAIVIGRTPPKFLSRPGLGSADFPWSRSSAFKNKRSNPQSHHGTWWFCCTKANEDPNIGHRRGSQDES